MKFVFNFPDLGEGLEEGTILEWYVKVGDKVKVGDILVQMETDKVVADIPSPKDGVITKLHGDIDDVVKVGSSLVEFEVEGEAKGGDLVKENIQLEETDADQLRKNQQKKIDRTTIDTITELEDNNDDDDAGSVVGTIEVAGKDSVIAASHEGFSDKGDSIESQTRKALATPVARAMAKQYGIDINEVQGSGPSGRVKKEDVVNFNAQKGSVNNLLVDNNISAEKVTDDVIYAPLSQIRKTIAKNMLQSKQSAAHMTVFEEVEITGLIKVREKYKQRFADNDVKLTYLPFIIKAVAQALKHHPQLNSQLDMENNRIIYRNRYHIGIAVDAPDGLVVPVIRDADRLSVFQIAKQIGELAEKARTRKLTLDNLKDGSFSITSFGSIGGIFATPVINYPQAGILGIGRILKTPIVKGDEIVIGTIMPLSLSVDHRVADGGETTRFLNRIVEYISDPISFIMDEM